MVPDFAFLEIVPLLSLKSQHRYSSDSVAPIIPEGLNA
jgi:hypothetical protein